MSDTAKREDAAANGGEVLDDLNELEADDEAPEEVRFGAAHGFGMMECVWGVFIYFVFLFCCSVLVCTLVCGSSTPHYKAF